jgi:hypothetical protein
MNPRFHLHTLRRCIRLSVPSLTLALVLAACGGDGGSPSEPEETINSIPISEINRVPPPTYAMVAAAFDKVVGANPSLRQDPPALARAVFDEVKRQRGVASTINGDLQAVSLSDLTLEEWKVLLGDPGSGWAGRNAPGTAESIARSSFSCDAGTGFENDRADAVRHAYWNALMARRIAAEYGVERALRFTEDFTNAHESNTNDQSPVERRRAKEMDLSNNAAGRRVFFDNQQATDDQLLALILALPFIYAGPQQAITRDDRRLVYMAGQQPFDGAMTGSMSNPDSGGPWNALFYFTQCNNNIRGSFTITRGNELQKRRFSGTVGGAAIALTIDIPFEFENPNNNDYCRGMTAVLGGFSGALSGTWRSSNCTRGGVIELKR